jgi:hypothetical protein
MDKKIDFVIPWVDGSDPLWLELFNKYSPEHKFLNTKDRFRDWDNLHFLFRAFEQFTPWVNKIYFITHDPVPKWLNVEHSKLVIVKHEDYMLTQNLPVFSANPIETNIHRIKGLSEHFVFFNDDTFIVNPIKQEEFFQEELPVDMAISNIMHEGTISHIVMNDIDLINKNFNRHVGEKLTKRGIIKKHFFKWFNLGYGTYSFRTLLLLYWKTFTGFLINHHPQPYLKSTFEEVWAKESEILQKTASSKFRHNDDVNQYLFRYWQLVKGDFYPAKAKAMINQRKYIEVRTLNDIIKVTQDIKSRKFNFYCINDAISKGRFTKKDMSQDDFEEGQKQLEEAFLSILPNKSSFEL